MKRLTKSNPFSGFVKTMMSESPIPASLAIESSVTIRIAFYRVFRGRDQLDCVVGHEFNIWVLNQLQSLSEIIQLNNPTE